MNSFFVISFLILAVRALEGDSNKNGLIKNDAFCKDFFNPKVRKQLINMKISTMLIYVNDNPQAYNSDDGYRDMVIIGKDKLVIIDASDAIYSETRTGRDAYIFKDFVKQAVGTRCYTNLIVPFVVIMCAEKTYVGQAQPDGRIPKMLVYDEVFLGLNMDGFHLPHHHEFEQTVNMFQHLPGGGAIYMNKTVNFNHKPLDLGITNEEFKVFEGFDEKRLKKKHKFKYIRLVDCCLSNGGKLPEFRLYFDEGKEKFEEMKHQCLKSAPFPISRNSNPKLSFIYLNRPEDIFYEVQKVQDAGFWCQKTDVHSKPIGSDLCYFQKEDVLYERGPAYPDPIQESFLEKMFDDPTVPMIIVGLIMLGCCCVLLLCFGGSYFAVKMKQQSNIERPKTRGKGRWKSPYNMASTVSTTMGYTPPTWSAFNKNQSYY